MARPSASLLSVLGLAALPSFGLNQAKTAQGPGPDEARSSARRGAEYLQKEQHPDGSWGSGAIDSVQFIGFSPETYYAFKMAANGLAFMALAALEDTPERRGTLDKSLEWLLVSRVPKRGSDWDVDCSWAALWGFNAMVAAAKDPRFQSEKWKGRIETRAKEFYALLEQNQEPAGGWGYYEGPVVSRRPTWSTSFSTACVIPALVDAQKMGWPIDPKVTARAVDYVKRCRLPSGAYTYDHSPVPWVGGESINDIKGSLGRIQVCNLARRRAGDPKITDEEIRKGLKAFFDEHRFLDAARMKPMPHESWYFNAAYFYFFGHYFAALAIEELPAAEREAWHAKLRAELVKVQWNDGSSIDFPNMSCMRIAGTSFSILALHAGTRSGP
ncbi:MAG: hypothetical protein ACKVXR_13005 [Planctomycetota bacterium]